MESRRGQPEDQVANDESSGKGNENPITSCAKDTEENETEVESKVKKDTNHIMDGELWEENVLNE